MTGRAGSYRHALVAAVTLAALITGHDAAAQRGRGGRPDISSLGSPTDFYVHPLFAGNPTYDGRFTFARIKYRGFAHYTNEGPGWAHDFPEADENLMKILKEVTSARPFIVDGKIRGGAIVALDDPQLFRYPVSYLSEPGGWFPNDQGALGLMYANPTPPWNNDLSDASGAYDVTVTNPTSTPEPATLLLLATGMAGVSIPAIRRRRRKCSATV